MTAEPPPGGDPYGHPQQPGPQYGPQHGQQYPQYGQQPGPQYGTPQDGGYGAPYGTPPPYGAPQQYAGGPGGQAPLAVWWERWVARIVDGLIFGILYSILASIFNSMFGPSVAEILADPTAAGSAVLPALLAGIIAYGAYAAYDYVLHSKDGQTLGKKLMKIRLASVSGGPLDSGALMKRSAIFPGVMALYGIPIIGWLASISVLVLAVLILVDKPLHQGPHDKIAGTVVVKVPR
jgi:uncharacterized RDD family membrane protein YckC